MGALDFENVIANTDASRFNVAPAANYLGTEMNLKINVFVGKVLNLGHGNVVPSVVFQVRTAIDGIEIGPYRGGNDRSDIEQTETRSGQVGGIK